MRFRLLISALIICNGFSASDATDTIKQGESIYGLQTIVSGGKKYELGFIQRKHKTRFYLGIWYAADQNRSAVWIANRYYPVLSSAVLTLTDEGNLVIIDRRMTYMIAETSAGAGAQARLLDSGNLIVQKGESELFWQSFDYPTNTLLPGMNIGYDFRTQSIWYLTSWKSDNDALPGNFTLQLDFSTLYLAVYSFDVQYWVGDPSLYLGSNFYVNRNSFGTYITWFSSNSSEISRLVLDSKGQLVRQSWSGTWESLSSSKCKLGSCGSNSICNVSSSPEQSPCCCLPGFHPAISDWSRNSNFTGDCVRPANFTVDCVRPANFTCNKKNENDFGFFTLSDVVTPANISDARNTTKEDCQSSCLKNCSCSGFSYIVYQRSCLHWTGPLLNLQTSSDVDSSILDFNLKVLLSDMNHENISRPIEEADKKMAKRNKIQVWVIAVLTSSLTFFALALLLYHARKRILRKVGEDLLLFDLNTTPKDDESEFSETYGKERSSEVKMPLFSFSSVSAATDNFSDENKLGEGGFGPVYKGKTLRGNEIAVKRLSQKSKQGWDELKNEALLIAKLQHKNLVRLLGCCIERDEKILIYEYMPNKSLDYFLFDPDRRKILDWGMRVRIIEGIAQGLLYLHEYSRFRIVHRDLKVSNILLDAEMNPKIADFGMARMFGGDESEANTNRIVGTFGYMSPEYALEGTYSTKSDVFSFGVLLLEIVSGRKNTGFYSNKASNLLGHAWDLWTSGKGLNLIDPDLKESSSTAGLRYVNVALLCVQDSPDDRPSMSNVVSMLGNETIPLSPPNQPGFLNMRSGATSVSGKSRVEISSVDETPVGMSDPR